MSAIGGEYAANESKGDRRADCNGGNGGAGNRFHRYNVDVLRNNGRAGVRRLLSALPSYRKRHPVTHNRFDLLAGLTLIGGAVVLMVVLGAAIGAALWLIVRTI